MSRNIVIRKLGVLGAGTMGFQIAGHVANAGFPVVLLDIVMPPAFTDPEAIRLVTRGTFDDHLQLLADCDWIIEAVTEDLAIKRALLGRISAVRREGSIISTNTSGISIRELGEGMPDEFRRRWLGTHFFNPPRYMRLLEVIPTGETDPDAVETVIAFADVRLGKTIVRAKDTPNFIGNRIWTFALLNTMRVMQAMDLTIEEVDALTGPAIGWPKTATFRLCDLVGLDVLTHISGRADVPLPDFVTEMVRRGWLGDKAGQGFYKKPGLILNWNTLEYRPAENPKGHLPPRLSSPEDLRKLLKGEYQFAVFYRKILPELWEYAAARIPEISDDIVAIDEAMKAGFNWKMGPFEMWDASGRVPPWYREGMFLDPLSGGYKAVPVARGVLSVSSFRKANGVSRANAGASLIDLGERIGCLEFHTKMNAIDTDIMALVTETLEANNQFDGFVIASDTPDFSAGANLVLFLEAIQAKRWNALDALITAIQRMTQAIKFCPRPVVAAPVGHCLGGGAEVALHAARRQAHTELRMGLVEAAVGLVPAAGGCKEMVLRSPDISQAFANIVTAKTSTSAADARRLNYLSEADGITMNRARLLSDAKQCVLEMVRQSYSAPVPRVDIPAPQLEPPEIQLSGHDVTVATHIARILTGGGVLPGTLLAEQDFLDLERESFLSLCGEKKTEERIAYTLKTGKPLKN